MQNNSGISDFGHQVPYDLRQIYAVEIVGESLKDMLAARKADNYSMQLKCMNDVFIVIRHKIKKKTYTDGANKEVNAIKFYNEMYKFISDLARKNPSEWHSARERKKDPAVNSMIEESLAELEIFLYEMIQEAGLFGGKDKIPGL